MADLTPDQVWQRLAAAVAAVLERGPLTLRTAGGEDFQVTGIEGTAIRIAGRGGTRLAVTRTHIERTWRTWCQVRRTDTLVPYLHGPLRTPVAAYALALLEAFGFV